MKTKQIEWLEKEYPKGVDLVYIDRNDQFSTEQLDAVLKYGYSDDYDEWLWEAQDYAATDILENYQKENTLDEVSDDERESIKDWLHDNDTSTVTKDLLRNTPYKLFFIETTDEFIKDEIVENGFMMDKQYPETISNNNAIIAKYGTTDDQKKEIRSTFQESFYSAPISFYFYASPCNVYEVLYGEENKSKYVTIEGAYFSTITRHNGSNWLGNKAMFTVSIPRQQFIDNLHLDEAKGTGYSWKEIAGQSGYDEAQVNCMNEIKGSLLDTDTSAELKREAEYTKKWNGGKGDCTFGDMNMSRHKETPYKNEYPCGNTCTKCNTFWID